MESLLQHFIFGSLVSVCGRHCDVTVPDLFKAKTRHGYYLSFSKDSFLADFHDEAHVAEYFASDITRFASASFQTICKAETYILSKDNIAWGLIMAYYAAFYAAHCLSRIFGQSVSFFDRSQISAVSRMAAAMALTPTLNLGTGAYRVVIENKGSSTRVTQARKGSGGAHEIFWDAFGGMIDDFCQKLLQNSSSSDHLDAFRKLDSLRIFMSSNGAPLQSWLSIMRNDVQYRHSCGVWLPTRLKKHSREHLSRIASQWRRLPSDIDVDRQQTDSLSEFLISCAFIISLSEAMLRLIADRSMRRSSSFAELGALCVLKECCAAGDGTAAG